MSNSNTVSVRALKFHTFGGKEYNEGDHYTIEGDQIQTAEQYAHTVCTIGFAEPAKTKVLVADDEAEKKGGDYKRRDMTAKR